MESATGDDQQSETESAQPKGIDAVNAAIFGGGYAMPGLDDLDD